MFLTEFRFVSTRMIKLFDFIMRIWAIAQKTSFLLERCTFSMLILLKIWPAIIFGRVIKKTEAFLMRIYD